MEQCSEKAVGQFLTSLFSLSAGPSIVLVRRPSGYRVILFEPAQLLLLAAWSPLLVIKSVDGCVNKEVDFNRSIPEVGNQIRSSLIRSYLLDLSSVAQDQLLPDLNSV